jgi:hypothetical protein
VIHRLAALALVALAATACSDSPKPPPQARGEWFQINPARWAAAQPAPVAEARAR